MQSLVFGFPICTDIYWNFPRNNYIQQRRLSEFHVMVTLYFVLRCVWYAYVYVYAFMQCVNVCTHDFQLQLACEFRLCWRCGYESWTKSYDHWQQQCFRSWLSYPLLLCWKPCAISNHNWQFVVDMWQTAIWVMIGCPCGLISAFSLAKCKQFRVMNSNRMFEQFSSINPSQVQFRLIGAVSTAVAVERF
jgi:hypothetical protein